MASNQYLEDKARVLSKISRGEFDREMFYDSTDAALSCLLIASVFEERRLDKALLKAELATAFCLGGKLSTLMDIDQLPAHEALLYVLGASFEPAGQEHNSDALISGARLLAQVFDKAGPRGWDGTPDHIKAIRDFVDKACGAFYEVSEE